MAANSHNVLLIEPSATQRYVLEQTLRAAGHSVAIAETLEVAVGLLANAGQPGFVTEAVVLDWPAQTLPAASDLLLLLGSEACCHIPVLVLCPEPDIALNNWCSERSNRTVLEWRNRSRVGATLETLIAVSSLPSLAQAVIAPEPDSIRVLLVDDSPSVRSHYRKLLIRHGYVVDVAASVADGFCKAQQKHFDIAIVDYFMPDGNGDVLCRRLHNDPGTRDISVAMFTGSYVEKVIKDALDAGATECMFKNEVDALFLTRVAAMSRSIRSRSFIEAERQRLQSILHSVGDGVYGVDSRGLVCFVNPAALRILGYKHEREVLGRSPVECFHGTDADGQPVARRACRLQRAYGRSAILRGWETVFSNCIGVQVPVECTVYPMYLDGGLEGSVVAFRDISERKSFEEKLRWQASHDPLTELFNRRYFEDALDKEFERLTRSSETSALLYINLDRFKYINDTASHDAGDRLLVHVGERLRERLRSTDTLARLGGDEFVVLLRNVDNSFLHSVADAFRATVGQVCFHYEGKSYSVQGSVGVATFDGSCASPGDILARADMACHVAKTAGGNQVHLYVEANDYRSEMGADLGWSARLREAIDQDLFELHFHPIVPIAAIDMENLPDESGAIWSQIASDPAKVKICFEVLLRLRAPDSSLIMPGAFLASAERLHLMPEIDLWVLHRAIRALGAFQRVWKEVVFAINLAGQTLIKPDLVGRIRALLAQYEVAPGSIAFEITETSAIANLPAAQRVINELAALGCQFSLDDFGTGFSSFAHLKHLNVDCVKIDGLFVRGMTKDPTDHAMVISMNDIAHFLGQTTVAEYVESGEILKLLSDCGVDQVQGFFIARPIPEQLACPGEPVGDTLLLDTEEFE
jgi:diguanylate cyclase (GGDEF)-like protein/PAS domain S-box-containing protein